MEEKSTRFDFEARYFTAGQLTPQTRQVWIVFHGYGQLASYFLKKFEFLAEKGIYLIAPEGLSRYYLSELTDAGRADNRVGATWMTSENRLMDIANYVRFLGAVAEKELRNCRAPVTLFGFSQGCATACRWATQGGINFERLILWAGLFPPDMNFERGHSLLSQRKTLMVTGKKDPYLTPDRMKEFDELAAKLGITPEKIVFDGKHELNAKVMEKLAME
jgi:predicted esterase